MKRYISLIVLSLVAISSCNDNLDEVLSPEQEKIAWIEMLIESQNREYDDAEFLSTLVSSGLYVDEGMFSINEDGQWERTHVDGGSSHPRLVFYDDGTCSHYYMCNNKLVRSILREYSYDPENNTIISIDPVSGDPLIAKVLYFSDNRVILEGALFVYNFRDPIRYVGIFSRELREEWETSSE